ncbi:MAG: septal ring lytic transglycosylase RlpA family protein [bacterium]|nr:septal ring lytic transglycosylase RlpA family protein [bacterium]
MVIFRQIFRIVFLVLLLGVLFVIASSSGCSRPMKVVPQEFYSFRLVEASHYGIELAGRKTANGEVFNPSLLTAAHKELPFGTIVQVGNPRTKKSVRVRINDRGPYVGNREIDLSTAAANAIGFSGVGKLHIRVLKTEPRQNRNRQNEPAPVKARIVVPAGTPSPSL